MVSAYYSSKILHREVFGAEEAEGAEKCGGVLRSHLAPTLYFSLFLSRLAASPWTASLPDAALFCLIYPVLFRGAIPWSASSPVCTIVFATHPNSLQLPTIPHSSPQLPTTLHNSLLLFTALWLLQHHTAVYNPLFRRDNITLLSYI
jgi:hypothetical protein